jgi:hypothetical protein
MTSPQQRGRFVDDPPFLEEPNEQLQTLYDPNYQTNNQQASEESVSKHCFPPYALIVSLHRSSVVHFTGNSQSGQSPRLKRKNV